MHEVGGRKKKKGWDWFRTYHTVTLAHPPVATLSLDHKGLLLVLECLASQANQGGDIPLTFNQILCYTRISAKAQKAMFAELIGRELLGQDADGYFIPNWCTKQYLSDNSSLRAAKSKAGKQKPEAQQLRPASSKEQPAPKAKTAGSVKPEPASTEQIEALYASFASARPQVEQFIASLAEENKTGKVKASRIHAVLLDLQSLQNEVGTERLEYGLAAANTRSVPNINYVKKASYAANRFSSAFHAWDEGYKEPRFKKLPAAEEYEAAERREAERLQKIQSD
ncbi:MAG TPA: hypothetical protein VLH56_10195 [Dissulfurispiraceae bacterium]|nr:hypothetical protein [Dissulfurispiraceae bacterium]